MAVAHDVVTPVFPQLSPFSGGTKKSTEPQGRVVSHHYFAHGSIYSGFDLVLEPLADPTQARVSFRRLSLSAADLDLDADSFLEPVRYPEARVVSGGDQIVIDPLVRLEGYEVVELVTFTLLLAPPTPDEMRSRSILDHVMLPQPRVIFPRTPSTNARAEMDKIRYRKQCEQNWADRFSVTDSVLCIVKPQVRVSGVLEALLVSGESPQRVGEMLASEGALRWFYVPGGGRYVYALVPRPGLAPAGEVAGSAMKLNVNGRQVVLESAVPLTPGGDSYPVYARHEADWQPEEDRDLDRMLLGTLP